MTCLFTFLISALCPVFFSLSAFPAIITAASGSTADVKFALTNSISAGDTVIIPASSNRWTAGVVVTVPNNVNIIGAGTTNTGGGDQTVIVDDIASDTPLFQISGGGSTRISGITFQSGTGVLKNSGVTGFYGMSQLRIDHCHFIIRTSSHAIEISRGVFGVADHNFLDFQGRAAFYIRNSRGSDNGGNTEWSLPTDFGGTNYFFIEDNIFLGSPTGDTYDTRVFDGYTGGKVVVRFNSLTNCTLGESHATGHAGDDRGLRSQETYGNAAFSELAYSPNYAAVTLYGGTALVWGNSWNNVFKTIYRLQVVRINADTYYQNSMPDGWGYAGSTYGNSGGRYNSAGGAFVGTNVTSIWDGNANTNSGYPALDQPGRGQGDLLTGDFPNKINSTTNIALWPNQALEPMYVWNNSGGVVAGWGDFVWSDGSGGLVLTNRDYYGGMTVQTSPTSPFDGTGGMGFGTLANRPTTCTPGVAYFATDQGSWNTSSSNPYGVQQNGADGVLYKCEVENTWTLYVTPARYPSDYQSIGASSPALQRYLPLWVTP